MNPSITKDELDSFTYIARSGDTMDPRYQRVMDFVEARLADSRTPYLLIEYGPGMTNRDADRIIGNMKYLYDVSGLRTISIWVSKDSCPYISIPSR